jgi:CIC family chloride channel protein
VGLLGLASPSILGVGYDAIAAWLAGGGGGREAALAFVVKGAAVSIALAAPLVGGAFAPSLFLGASLGAATGHLLQSLLPDAGIDPAAYALVGMGAFFAGFLRTPVASVLIVFELTGDYGLVVPLMMAVAIASLVARKLSPYTLVERQLEDEGISTSEVGPDPLARRRVADAMSRGVVTFAAARPLAEVWPEAERREHAMYPVVDEHGFCVGVIEEAALKAASRVGQLADEVRSRTRPARVVATPDEAIDRVLLRLGSAGETRCPVVESLARPRVVGFLAPTDVLRLRVRASLEGAEGPFEPLR